MRSLISPLNRVIFDGLCRVVDWHNEQLHDSDVMMLTGSGNSSENLVGHLVVFEGLRKGCMCWKIFLS